MVDLPQFVQELGPGTETEACIATALIVLLSYIVTLVRLSSVAIEGYLLACRKY